MKFHITTQYLENYGDAANPYWKYKGGEEYIVEVPGFKYDTEFSDHHGQMIVDDLSKVIEYSNEYQQQYIIGWGFVPDDFQTLFESDQLKYDGEIKFPAKRVTYEELLPEAA